MPYSTPDLRPLLSPLQWRRGWTASVNGTPVLDDYVDYVVVAWVKLGWRAGRGATTAAAPRTQPPRDEQASLRVGGFQVRHLRVGADRLDRRVRGEPGQLRAHHQEPRVRRVPARGTQAPDR